MYLRRIPKTLSWGFFVLLAWGFVLWLLTTQLFSDIIEAYPEQALTRSALIGDTLGAFSALMAAFAAVGAILALVEQRNAVKRQMFVSTLVAMLDRLQQTIADTDFFVIEQSRNEDGDLDERIVETQSGQNAFYEMSQELRLLIAASLLEDMDEKSKIGMLVLLYPRFYESYKNELGHFFRQLYHIVRYIDEQEEAEQERFVKLVRASLTNSQLLLLAYNAVAGEGRIKFAKYIERYSILHNLSFENDELGLVERQIIELRLGERSLISATQTNDRLSPEYRAREDANANAKIHLKRFLDQRGYSINYGVSWHTPN